MFAGLVNFVSVEQVTSLGKVPAITGMQARLE